MTVSIKAEKYVFKDSAGNVLMEAGEQEVETIKGAGGAKNQNPQLQKVFDLTDDYKLSDDVYNGHIMERHGSELRAGISEKTLTYLD